MRRRPAWWAKTTISGSADRSRGWKIPRLLLGRGRFAADISFPHQLHMRVVRSNHAHGKILSIDCAAARALPGVFAVWTWADIADVQPIDFREGRIEKLEPYRQPVLACERVRYVGEPVAVVFADNPLPLRLTRRSAFQAQSRNCRSRRAG
jgi:CO/xanthine dehydrogenase Mo-binding subunit